MSSPLFHATHAPIQYERLPESLQDGMRRYVEQRLAPGSFLLAVLRNDLTEAVFCADDENRARLPDIVQWVYDELPCMAWGTKERVRAWLDHNRDILKRSPY